MGNSFHSVGSSSSPELMKLLTELPRERYLETLLFHAVSYDRRLNVAGGIIEGREQPIFVTLEDRSGFEAVARFSRERLIELSPGFEPRFGRLCETVSYFSDQDGFTPDVDWFERRNARLRLVENEKIDAPFGAFLAPASAITPLIVSYALSSAGCATVRSELFPTKTYEPVECFVINLQFFGSDRRGAGWNEKILVPRNRLERLLYPPTRARRGKHARAHHPSER